MAGLVMADKTDNYKLVRFPSSETITPRYSQYQDQRGSGSIACDDYAHPYCSFALGERGISEIELYGLRSWYTASLCHHNGAAKRSFDESPLWSS